MKVFFFLFVSYLLGSIPFGYIFTKLIKKVDIRKFGSGNIGATNVARVMGFKYGGLIALMDILKGFIAVWLVYTFLPETQVFIPFLAGLLVILGHDFSLFLKFSGGKGVATTVGVILKLMPMVILFGVIIWILLIVLTRYVSLGSIIAAISLPFFFFILDKGYYALLFTFMAAILIIFNHR